MTTGSEITAAGFKTIQDKADSLLGVGTGSRGYDILVQSTDYSPGTRIDQSQWNLLKYDIINLKYHQDGIPPSIVSVNPGDLISYGAGSPNTNYNTLLESAIANRFNIGAAHSSISSVSTKTYTSTWATQAICTIDATFASYDQARHFFNRGGKIRVTPQLVGGSATSQVNAWRNFLTSVGMKEFGAATNYNDLNINFYTLTSAYQTFYQTSLSTPYSANNFRLRAKYDIAINKLSIEVSLNDSYVDTDPTPPGDAVDGTLTIYVEQLTAAGAFSVVGDAIDNPTSSFSGITPSYSVSNITAS
jgi:hypothetical protein